MTDALERVAEEIELNADLAMVLFQFGPDATIVVRESGTIGLVNRRAELLSGYVRADLIGQAVEMLLPESLRDRHESHRAAYMDDPRIRPMGEELQLLLRRKNGAEVPVLINLAPAMTKQGMFVIASIRRRAA